MEKLKVKLVKTGENGLFHDSREDAKRIAKIVNSIIDKVNELVDENNRLNRIIADNSPKL